MVLTTVPQTALPVLAAEGDVQDEIQIDLPAESEEETPADSVEPVAGEEDGETEEEETPAPAESEITEEESEEEEPAEDADLTEEADGEAEEETPVEPAEEEITEPEQEESEDESSDATVNNVINAAGNSESAITYKSVDAADATKGADTATIEWKQGCVSGGKLVNGKDLRFTVAPVAGRSVSKVEITIDGKTETLAADATSKIYTVENAKFSKKETVEGNETTKPLNAEIVITTTAQTYTVTFGAAEDAAASSYEIYTVTEQELADKSKVKVLDTKVTAPVTSAVFDTAVEYAVVATTGNKFVEITAEGKPVTATAGSLNKKDDAEDADKTACYTFSLKPSDYVAAGDEGFTVKVKAVKKAELTAKFAEGDTFTVAAPTETTGADIVPYVSTDFGTALVEGAAGLDKKKLAFKLTPVTDYKITDVTAKAVDADKVETTLTVTRPTGADGTKAEEDTIALEPVKAFSSNTEIIITVTTEYTNTANVHAISFKAATGKTLDHVGISLTDGTKEVALKDNAASVTGDTAKVTVSPHPGYELAKATEDDVKTNAGLAKNDPYITVIRNKSYPAVTGDTAMPAATGREEKKVKVTFDSATGAAEAVSVDLAKGKDAAYEGAVADAADRDYVVTSVEVVIDASLAANTEEKIVVFDDQLEDGYEITTKGVIIDETATGAAENDTWVIPEGVDELEFAVTTTSTPAVTCTGFGDEIIKETSSEGGKYTYTIPTSAIDTKTDSKGTITIKEAAVINQNVNVKVDTVSNVKSVQAEIDGSEKAEYIFNDKTPDSNGFYKVAADAVKGKELVLNVTPADGAKITKLSYTMGEGEEAAAGEGTVAEDGTASLTIDSVTADVAVSVESASDYAVVLTGAGISGKDGVYKADYTVKDITVTLVKTGTAYTERFYDIIVKDGSDVASTDAKLAANGQSATIEAIAKNEYGKTLTIEVYTGKETKYMATLETTAYSEAVTVTRVDTGKAVKETDTVGMMADSKMEFTVTPAKGAKLTDLDVEILSTKENATDKDNTDAAALLETPVFKDGKLILQAKTAKEAKGQVLVSIFNTNEEADKDGKKPHKPMAGGKFIVDLKDPLIKTDEIKKVTAAVASATNRDVRLNLNVEFKNKKNPPAKPIVGDLYYKVEVDTPTGAPEDVVKPIDKYTQYVKITDFSNPAVTLPISLVKSNTEDKEGIVADIAAVISSNAKVSLVQSISDKNLADPKVTVDEAADCAAGPDTLTATAALATKLPVYETKLAVKAVNGATVFTGQNDAKVATPTFTKDTSYDAVYVQLVNSKTGIALSEESVSAGKANKVTDTEGYRATSAWVDENDNSIHVSVDGNTYINQGKYTTDYYKNLGVKVIAVGPDDSYRASAVVKLKVQQGIESIYFDDSKAALPETLYKESDDKPASAKMTVVLNGGQKEYKPAKSTVAWSVAPESGVSASAYEKAAVEGKKPLVSVKNGKLTVDKNYRIQDTVNGDTYTVTAKAADFARTEDEEVREEINFTITGKKNDISKVVLLDEDNKILSSPLSAETFDAPVYVAAVSSEAKEPKKGQTYEDTDFLPVTFKSSAKAAVDVVPDSEYGYKYSNKGRLIFHKPGTKIKITASTVDGGKVLKKDAVFDVNGYGTLGLRLRDTDYVSNDPGTLTRSYAGGSNQKYELYLAHKNGDQWEEDDDYKSVKVKVSGGKFVANKNWAKNPDTNYLGDVIVVSDLKKAAAEITLTDTATKDSATRKNKEYKYTITNTNKSITKKAPGIKLIDPKKPAKGSQTLTWQITDKNANNYVGNYVMLAPDYTVTSSNYASSLVGNGTIRKIDENGQFTLENQYLYAGGSYKMIATVGELEGGRFTTSTKDAKISFTVPKDKKANNNLSVTASYTLDPGSAAFARIAVKTDASYTVSDAMNVIKKSKDQDKDVHTNDFTTYFEVKGNKDADGDLIELNNADEEYAYIGLKDNLSAKMIADIMDKTKKDDCTGYITVDNGTYRKDIQIKISFKTLKYTATSASVFATQTAATPVVQVMNGKVPVKAAFATIDGTSEFAKEVKAQEDGTLLITSNTPVPAAGKYDVNLLVVPEDSRYIVSDGKGGWTFINKGEGATADPLNENALYEGGYAVPVTAKIEVKALDTKKVVNIKSTNVTLNTGLFDAVENGNGYKLGEAGKTGSYVVDIPYTFVAGNTAIGDTATDVAVELKDKDGKNLNEIGADKELLVKASKQSVKLKDGTFKQVIRLEVSKKALVALSAMSAADKPITVYGKKLTVPVVLKYTNGVQAETVKFNITMPKKAPKEFKDVVADVKAAELDKTQSGNKTAAQDILDELVGKVVKKAEEVIAADTDVIVGQIPLVKKDWGETEDPAPETSDAAADVIDSGTANITLTLTNNADANAETKTEKVLVPCKFTIKHSDGDVATVEGAIRAAVNTIAVDNTTTDGTLREDIEGIAVGSKKVSDYLVAGKGNLSLEILNFKKTNATAKKSGTVTATIQIRDILVTGNSGKKTVPFSGTIGQLDNIAAIKNAVVTATDATALAAIIEACSGQDKLIKTAVLAAATDAAKGNPDIEVGFAQKDGKDDYTYKAIAADPDNEGSFLDGSVTYTLVVKNKVTGRTMKCPEVTATLDQANKDKYVTVAKAKELVENAVVDSKNSNTALKTLVGTSNDAATIQNAIKNAADGALAGVTGYACEWKKLDDGKNDDFTYTPADSKNDGKLKFTLVVKSKNEFAAADTDGKAEVALAETAVLTHAGAYQSAAEMKAAIETMAKSIAVEESTIIAGDSTAAIAAIQAEVNKLKATDSKLDPKVSATTGETDETKNSVWTKGTAENKTATLTNVKIAIDAKTTVTVSQFTFTVKADVTPPAEG